MVPSWHRAASAWQPQLASEKVELFANPVMMSRWTLTLAIPPEDADKRLAVRVGLSSAHANSGKPAIRGSPA